MKKLFVFIASFAILSAFAAQTRALSEKLRVLSVDLDRKLIETPGAPGGEVAQQLRTLLENADPDVICLQGVLDWETADRVARLKPGFRVITCSAFQSNSETNAAPQVAILARDKAAISWVEELSEHTGFAFALFQAGTRKLGVFSLQTAGQNGTAGTPSAAVTDRMLAEIQKLQRFPQNRPDSFLIAGSTLLKTSAIIEAGLQSISAEAPGAHPAPPVRSEFWVVKAGFIARPRAVGLKALKTPAIVSDFDSGSSFSSKFAYQTPLLFAGETPASLQAPVAPEPAKTRSTRYWIVIVGGAIAFLLVMMLLRRTPPQTQMALAPLNPAQPLAPGQREQIRSGLLEWLKSVFVQRLLSQRQQLLSNEADAARRTMVIEEKLSNLQTTLQSRISAYETRIERLEIELTAATSENRDLIRSQIDLLKEKVAKAKEEHAFRRN